MPRSLAPETTALALLIGPAPSEEVSGKVKQSSVPPCLVYQNIIF